MTQPAAVVTDDNPLTAATVAAASSYVESEAWAVRLERWAAGYAEQINAAILQAIGRGAGPLAVAAQVRQYAENVPVSAAATLTRTLQLTSYRDASVEMENINGGLIEYKIRIAAMDDRTCLSCIALHGTRLEVGERVDDHYNGRCTEFYVVQGGDRQPAFMQSDSQPGERNFVPYQSGEEWFAGLPPARQGQQAAMQNSPALLAAYNSGMPLSAFVGERHDDVFGRQVVQQSLIGALGEERAKEFYK